MARAIWSGSISFGLVNVPVKAYTAVRDHDTYTEELKDLLERKAKGEQIVVEEDAPAAKANVVDLMSALEASIAAAKKARGGNIGKGFDQAAERLAGEAQQGDGGRRSGTPKRGAAKRSVTRAPIKKPAAEKPAAKKAAAKKTEKKAPARASGRKSA